MADFLKTVDLWFLVLIVILLGGYFLWSVKQVFRDFKKSLEDMHKLIEKIFDRHDDFEKRLSSLEGRCDAMHGPGGRRRYDPDDRPGL